MKYIFPLLIYIFCGVILYAAENDGQKTVLVEAFVTPYQRQSINLENTLNSIRLRFRDRIKIKIYFSLTYDDKKDLFWAAGGENELAEIFRQACIYNNFPEKFWTYLIARNQDVYNMEWLPYAEFAGLNKVQIEDVADAIGSGKIKEILKENNRYIKQKSINEFPVLFVNGKQITDIGNLPHIASFINEMLLPADKLPGIVEVPDYDKPSKIKVLAVSNLYGFGSDLSTFNNALPEIAKNAEIETIEFHDSLAQRMIEKYKLDLIPAFLIKKPEVKKVGIREKSPKTSQLDSLVKRGILSDRNGFDYYVVPSSMIVYGLYLSRPIIEKKLEVFVMSFCPWGMQALLKLTEVPASALDLKMPVEFHYIVEAVSSNPKELSDFRALHGIPEIEENVRQLVIQKYLPEKFPDYIRQRVQNIESPLNIKKAFEIAGIDELFVTSKMEKEGVEFLLNETKLTKQFNITESPSFLWQNRFLLDVDSFNTIPKFKDLINLKGSCKK